jgi:hypothetical protein
MEQNHAGLLLCTPSLITESYTSSLGPTHHHWVLRVIVGSYALSLCPTRHRWILRVIVGSYTLLLGSYMSSCRGKCRRCGFGVLEPTSPVSKPPCCHRTHFASVQSIYLVSNLPGWCPSQVSNQSRRHRIRFIVMDSQSSWNLLCHHGIRFIIVKFASSGWNPLRRCGILFIVVESAFSGWNPLSHRGIHFVVVQSASLSLNPLRGHRWCYRSVMAWSSWRWRSGWWVLYGFKLLARGWGGREDKTNHDFHRGSFAGRTMRASQFLGPPSCFLLPISFVE